MTTVSAVAAHPQSAPVAKVSVSTSDADKQKQQQQQQQVTKKLPSAKPPPTSTKIPKSAVVMPNDPRSVSSSATLDFAFGDLPVKSVSAEKPQQQQQSIQSHPKSQPEAAVQEKTPEKPQSKFSRKN